MVESEVRGVPSPSPREPLAHQAWVKWGGWENPGNRLGAVSCQGPEPWPRRGSDFEVVMNSPITASATLLHRQSA